MVGQLGDLLRGTTIDQAEEKSSLAAEIAVDQALCTACKGSYLLRSSCLISARSKEFGGSRNQGLLSNSRVPLSGPPCRRDGIRHWAYPSIPWSDAKSVPPQISGDVLSFSLQAFFGRAHGYRQGL